MDTLSKFLAATSCFFFFRLIIATEGGTAFWPAGYPYVVLLIAYLLLALSWSVVRVLSRGGRWGHAGLWSSFATLALLWTLISNEVICEKSPRFCKPPMDSIMANLPFRKGR